jgi:hypothetical protein
MREPPLGCPSRRARTRPSARCRTVAPPRVRPTCTRRSEGARRNSCLRGPGWKLRRAGRDGRRARRCATRARAAARCRGRSRARGRRRPRPRGSAPRRKATTMHLLRDAPRRPRDSTFRGAAMPESARRLARQARNAHALGHAPAAAAIQNGGCSRQAECADVVWIRTRCWHRDAYRCECGCNSRKREG